MSKLLCLCFLIFTLFSADLSRATCLNTLSGIAHGIVRDVKGRILRYVDYDGQGLILDSQLMVSASPFIEGQANASQQRWKTVLHRIEKNAKKHQETFHYWMAEKTAQEIVVPKVTNLTQRGFPEGTRLLKLEVKRDSNEYLSLKKALTELGIGKTRGSTGDADQTILADVFFASSRKGTVPTFATADGGIIKPFCKLNPDCAAALARGQMFQQFQDGFEVTLNTSGGQARTIRILPFGPTAVPNR